MCSPHNTKFPVYLVSVQCCVKCVSLKLLKTQNGSHHAGANEAQGCEIRTGVFRKTE
jgi:hypothetical protein